MPIAIAVFAFSAWVVGWLMRRLYVKKPEMFSKSKGMNLFVGVFFSAPKAGLTSAPKLVRLSDPISAIQYY